MSVMLSVEVKRSTKNSKTNSFDNSHHSYTTYRKVVVLLVGEYTGGDPHSQAGHPTSPAG